MSADLQWEIFSAVKAIVVDSETSTADLNWESVPDPEFGPEEVLVDIHATAVNRADLLQRAGLYPPPPGAPPYLGLEMAGVVTAAGEAAGPWRPGDRVCALLSGGGYAEQVAVHRALVMPVSHKWDFERAAAIPEVFYTAFVNLFMEAGLSKDETVLIHGGASGVGTAAIQMARAAGCRVLATAGTAEKLAVCRELGAELAVDYKEGDFSQVILDHCGGADVVLDVAGGSHLERNLNLLNSQGRLVVISVLGGSTAPIDLGLMLRRRLRLIGSVLRSRTVEEKAHITREFQKRFWKPLMTDRIRPIIHAVLPVTRAQDAHDILERNQNIGKVVLTVRGS